jgi:serine/threonine-protein kinase
MVAKTSPVPRAPRLPSLAKYEVKGELGHGGMATVYRAHDPRLGRDVAVKLLHAHLRESAEVAARFATEARAVAKLRHPNIVEVFDVSGEDENEQFLVVELVRGPSLRKLLADHGALPPEVACAVVLEVLGGLASAHEAGVVHRDVKPENVLLEHRKRTSDEEKDNSGDALGGRVRVKLTDFGIAKLLDAQGVTSTGQVLGSPAHMAPEQIEGTDVDERADVFGAGVLFYECLVGHLPFEGQNPAQVLRRVLEGIYSPAYTERPEVGAVFSRICDKALAREPDDRYPSVRAMRDAIQDELVRLDVTDPKGELEAWFDDPEGYTKDHAARMVELLCARGDAARKRGNLLESACDYNRALAFAPNDAKLMKLVAGMQRSEARRATTRRVAPLVLVALLAGSSAFALTKRLKPVPAPPKPVVVETPLEIPKSAEPVALTSASSAPVAVRTVSRPTVTPPKPPAPSKLRTISFGAVRPPMGVMVTVDGMPSGEVSTERVLSVDDKSHELLFTCVQNMCVPDKRFVNAGDANERLTIELKVRDAQLVVDGNPNRTYGISNRPGIVLRSGAAVSVPMKVGSDHFTLTELETGRSVGVDLKSGEQTRKVFPPE